MCETKPKAQFGAREDRERIDVSLEHEFCKSNPAALSGARDRDQTSDPRNQQFYKSNPTAHSGARPSLLTPRQLAALRLLARGHGSMDVARRLGINRHTIPRWKRNLLFAAELRRMIERLTESALRLRPGSRMHHYSLYRAGVEPYPPTASPQENET